jgi:hypothetical protein
MLKQTIHYTDFNGNDQSEVVYFNLSKPELVELEVSYPEGFGDMLRAIIAAQDSKVLLAEFKKILLMAYGVKSEDGKRFTKSPELTRDFEQSAAYEAYFMTLITDEQAASKFVMGLLPADMAGPQDKPVLPPPPPLSVVPAEQ